MNMKNDMDKSELKVNSQAFEERTAARVVLVQMLYEWHMGDSSSQSIFSYRAKGIQDVDYVYLKQIFFQVIEHVEVIDQSIVPKLDRDISCLNPIELSILRLATHELMSVLEVPYRVVIDEAVELAKKFGAQDGHKYVNAVLDKLAIDLRKAEISD